MLRWSLIFFIIAIISGALGLTGVADASAGIAKFLFGLFMTVCVILLIAGLAAGQRLNQLFRR